MQDAGFIESQNLNGISQEHEKRDFLQSEVATLLRDRNRPDPQKTLALIQSGLTPEDILIGAQKAEVTIPVIDQTLIDEAIHVTRFLMTSLHELRELRNKTPNCTILSLARDADPLLDILVAMGETNVVRFPGSSTFWKDLSFSTLHPPSLAERFLREYGILNTDRHFIFLDAGLMGSIGETVLEKLPQITDEPSDALIRRFTNKIIGGDFYKRIIHNFPQLSARDVAQTFPWLVHIGFLNISGLSQNDFNRLLCVSLQNMPKYHRTQEELLNRGDEIYVYFDTRENSMLEPDKTKGAVATKNSCPVSKYASFLLQYTMMKEVLRLQEDK